MTAVVLTAQGSDRAGTLTRALYAPTWHNDRCEREELYYHTTTLLYVHPELYTVWKRFRSATLRAMSVWAKQHRKLYREFKIIDAAPPLQEIRMIIWICGHCRFGSLRGNRTVVEREVVFVKQSRVAQVDSDGDSVWPDGPSLVSDDFQGAHRKALRSTVGFFCNDRGFYMRRGTK
ncbi:hypothetical protein C8Q74DRAFT_1215259 [Fomes fomentarius]|nr:hypothetical protein C8Q74DRAFT_1215259 [Fomes fomentarius]